MAEGEGVALERLEITTCLKRGEVEVVTRYEPGAQDAYEAFEALVRERHPDTLFSSDGSTVDEQVAALLRGQAIDGVAAPSAGARTVATAESCTGGLLAARLTDLPGSSEYVKGGLVVYSNEAKVELAGVDAQLIETPRGGLGGGRARRSRRAPARASRGRRRRHHGHRGAGGRNRGEAGRPRVAEHRARG